MYHVFLRADPRKKVKIPPVAAPKTNDTKGMILPFIGYFVFSLGYSLVS
jgi:hypothetical protein